MEIFIGIVLILAGILIIFLEVRKPLENNEYAIPSRARTVGIGIFLMLGGYWAIMRALNPW